MASISRAGRLISPSAGFADNSRSSKFVDIFGGRIETREKSAIFAIHRSLPGPSGVPIGAIWSYIRERRPRHERCRHNIDEWQPHSRPKGLSVTNDLIASMVLAIWLYLLAGRGAFWLCQRAR